MVFKPLPLAISLVALTLVSAAFAARPTLSYAPATREAVGRETMNTRHYELANGTFSADLVVKPQTRLIPCAVPTQKHAARTAVIARTRDDTQYSPGVNVTGFAAGSFLACGALSATEAYRTVLGYNVPFIGNCEILHASIQVSLFSGMYPNGRAVAIQPHLLPSLLNWSGGITWNTVGSAIPSSAADLPVNVTMWGTTYDIDVSNIVKAWMAQDQTGPLNILLRDVNDNEGAPTQNAVLLRSGPGLNSLVINYAPRR